MTQNGKRMPLDAKEVPDGNIVLEAGRAIFLKPGDRYPGAHYTSHFSTCPDAKKHRGPRDRSGAEARRAAVSAPSDEPRPDAMARAIRSASWQIRHAGAPKANAYVYLQASAQVLAELGVEPDRIRDVVEGITRTVR